jgi:hypothetical protein
MGEGLAEWERVTAHVTRAGHIETVDYAPLAVYRSARAMFDAARRELEDYGPWSPAGMAAWSRTRFIRWCGRNQDHGDLRREVRADPEAPSEHGVGCQYSVTRPELGTGAGRQPHQPAGRHHSASRVR